MNRIATCQVVKFWKDHGITVGSPLESPKSNKKHMKSIEVIWTIQRILIEFLDMNVQYLAEIHPIFDFTNVMQSSGQCSDTRLHATCRLCRASMWRLDCTALSNFFRSDRVKSTWLFYVVVADARSWHILYFILFATLSIISSGLSTVRQSVYGVNRVCCLQRLWHFHHIIWLRSNHLMKGELPEQPRPSSWKAQKERLDRRRMLLHWCLLKHTDASKSHKVSDKLVSKLPMDSHSVNALWARAVQTEAVKHSILLRPGVLGKHI